MTREERNKALSEVLYIEDYSAVDTLMAATIANFRMIGDPVWLTLIGPSSAGKSQFIRPIAKARPELFLQLDDLTSNTLMSGNGKDQSLIFKIDGMGVICMDDLTVLFSKNSEDRNAILSQFRMIYDGRLSKASGKLKDGLTWQGHAGMIAGSTPTIYSYFSEVADMGERFINYRMKDMDPKKAISFVRNNPIPAREMDERLVYVYNEYLGELMQKIEGYEVPESLDENTMNAIEKISILGTKLRTPVRVDERDHHVTDLPVPEMPFRVMKQLINIGKAFQLMHLAETNGKGGDLPSHYVKCLEWIAWSLADEKRRAYCRAILACERQMIKPTARNISSITGLHHQIVERGLSVLTSIGVLRMTEAQEATNEPKLWNFTDYDYKEFIGRVDPPAKINEDELDEDD